MERFKQILEIPDFPEEIRDAYNKKELAIFLGAGISRLANCSSWNQLAKDLLEGLAEDNLIDYKTKEQLSCISDNKKLITIAFEEYKKENKLEEFYKIFNKDLDGNNNSDIYNQVAKLKGVYFTTNADMLLEKALFNDEEESVKYFSVSDCRSAVLEKKTIPFIYHIHGRKDDRNSLVFTTSQYLSTYNNPKFKKFLQFVFDNYRILFLGYGLNEFEVLDYLISKNSNGVNDRHFYLEGFFSYELEYANHMAEYYKTLGIKLIPYSKDKKGFNQQINIIRKWVKEIKNTTFMIVDEFSEIEKNIRHYSNQNKIIIFNLINNNKKNEHIFMHELPKSKDFMLWIEELINKDYFNIDRCPNIIRLDNGRYRGQYWDMLYVFVDLIKMNKTNKRFFDIAYEQLEKISDEICDKEEKMKNWLVIYSMWFIFINLPGKYITEKIVKFFRKAIKYDLDSNILWIDGLIENNIFNKISIDSKKYFYDFILGYNIKEGTSNGQIKPIVAEYRFNDVLELIKANINNNNAHIMVEIIERYITSIIDMNNYESYSFNRLEVLDIINYTNDIDYYIFLTELLRYSVLMLNKEELHQVINRWITDEREFYKIAAIYIISEKYKDFNEIFFQLDKNPFNDHKIYTQVYYLLKKNNEEICSDNENKKKLIGWIENTKFSIENNDKHSNKVINGYKVKVLELLAEFDTEVSGIINYYKEQEYYNMGDPFEELNEKMNGSRLDRSKEKPFFPDGFYETIPSEIYDYICKYIKDKTVDRYDSFIAGEELFEYLEKHIDKKEYILECYIKMPPILIGIFVEKCNMIKTKVDSLLGDSILDFSIKCIGRLSKIQINDDVTYAINITLSILNNYIHSITDTVKLNEIFNILIECLKHKPWKEHKDIDKIYTRSFSGVESYGIDIIIDCALKICEIDGNKNISEKLIDYIEERLSEQDINYKVRSIVATRLNALMYLNADRTLENLKKLFFTPNNRFSIASITGYVYLNNELYKQIHKFFHTSGIYKYVINECKEFNDDNKNVDYRGIYIKFITLYKIIDFEDEENNNIFNLVLFRRKKKEISSILNMINDVDFYKHQSNSAEYKKNSEKIWNKLYDELIKESVFKDIAEDMINYLPVVNAIDKNIYNKICVCIKEVKSINNYYRILKNRSRLITDSIQAKYVGEILFMMIDKINHISIEFTDIVKKIYSKDAKLAIKICNHGVDLGYEIFSRLLKKFRSDNS
ncbi:SIR2 family protein [Clostridium oceanicum]|uniref:SIR2-like domain-containing protein n=1 Tax=Clostridium oceanicum TaxID=1543 RepID=A0ABN1JJR9_9CLOT